LEVQDVARLSTNGIGSDFCEQAHEKGACVPTSFGLSEEQVKYVGAIAKHHWYHFSNKFNFGRPNRQNTFSGGNINFQPSQATN